MLLAVSGSAYFYAQDQWQVQSYNKAELIAQYAENEPHVIDSSDSHQLVELMFAPYFIGAEITLLDGEKIRWGKTYGRDLSSYSVNLTIGAASSEQKGSITFFYSEQTKHEHALWFTLMVALGTLFVSVVLILVFNILYYQLLGKPYRHLLRELKQIDINHHSKVNPLPIIGDSEFYSLTEQLNRLLNKAQVTYRVDQQRQQTIEHLEKQFRMIFEKSHAGIALINAQNKILIRNEAFSSIFEMGLGGKHHYPYLVDMFEDVDEVTEVLNKVRSTRSNVFRDFKLKNSRDTWLRSLFSIVEDSSGQLGEFVEIVVYDISDRTKIERIFEYNAMHDPLTGVYNRRGGESRFKTQLELAQQRDKVFVLVLLDLNNFKPVNDKYGHDAGDIVLKEISARLLYVLRSDDVLVRWGGDEFIITMVLDNLHRLSQILTGVQNVFRTPIEVSSSISVNVSASIGVSTSLTQGYHLSSLLESADDVMYDVKRRGGNKYRIHNEQDIESHLG
jgi:diguanylate cyclase (GGDEF)-like protein/PAS domain S-box-containing protein